MVCEFTFTISIKMKNIHTWTSRTAQSNLRKIQVTVTDKAVTIASWGNKVSLNGQQFGWRERTSKPERAIVSTGTHNITSSIINDRINSFTAREFRKHDYEPYLERPGRVLAL